MVTEDVYSQILLFRIKKNDLTSKSRRTEIPQMVEILQKKKEHNTQNI